MHGENIVAEHLDGGRRVVPLEGQKTREVYEKHRHRPELTLQFPLLGGGCDPVGQFGRQVGAQCPELLQG